VQVLGSLLHSGRANGALLQKVAGDLIRRLDDSSTLVVTNDVGGHAAGNAPPVDAYEGLQELKGKGGIHFVVTSGGGAYMEWQTKIMYQSVLDVTDSFRKGDITSFTRVLHANKADELDIPTFFVDMECKSMAYYCGGYRVAQRPRALRIFLQTPGAVKAEYIFLGETDYIAMHPIMLPRLATGEVDEKVLPLAHKFGYIAWSVGENEIKEYLPSMTQIEWDGSYNTGPAPALLRADSLARIMPDYENLTGVFETVHPTAKAKFGWVREMWAYSLAAALSDLPHHYAEFGKPPYNGDLILEPGSSWVATYPLPAGALDSIFIHYTYPIIAKDSSSQTIFQWDKRAKKPFPGMDPLPEIPDEIYIEEVDEKKVSHLKKVHKDHVELWRFMRIVLNDVFRKIGFIAD